MTRAALPTFATALLLAFGSPRPAYAKPGAAAAARPDPSSATAKRGAEQFTDGRRLYKDGAFAAALPLFESALEVSGSPNARLYVARTLRELGRLPEAYDEMSTSLADARSLADAEPRYAETRDAAAAELAALESKIGRLVVALGPGATDVEVRVDGKLVQSQRLGRVMVVEPGTRTIVATRPDQREVRREVTIEPGATESVLVEFESGAQPAAVGPSPDSEGAMAFGPVRAAGVVVAVVGVAGLVVYAVSASQAKSSYDTLNEQCGGQRCVDLSYADEVDHGETMEILSHVSLAVGLAAAVAGGIMLVIGDPEDEQPAQSATVGVRAGGPWLSYEARF